MITQRECDSIQRKQSRLPGQYVRAVRRVKQLEAEFVRYGMKDWLNNPELINKAWERTVADAKKGNSGC